MEVAQWLSCYLLQMMGNTYMQIHPFNVKHFALAHQSINLLRTRHQIYGYQTPAVTYNTHGNSKWSDVYINWFNWRQRRWTSGIWGLRRMWRVNYVAQKHREWITPKCDSGVQSKDALQSVQKGSQKGEVRPVKWWLGGCGEARGLDASQGRMPEANTHRMRQKGIVWLGREFSIFYIYVSKYIVSILPSCLVIGKHRIWHDCFSITPQDIYW